MLGLANAPLQTAVDAANHWIEEEAVTVLNIETLRHTNGASGMTSTREDGIRVWYVPARNSAAPTIGGAATFPG